MKAKHIIHNSQEVPDDLTDKDEVDEEDTPQDITLTHKEAEAGSPYENTGEEDPGAALESLVSETDLSNH